MTILIDDNEDNLKALTDKNLAQGDWGAPPIDPWIRSMLPKPPMIHKSSDISDDQRAQMGKAWVDSTFYEEEV